MAAVMIGSRRQQAHAGTEAGCAVTAAQAARAVIEGSLRAKGSLRAGS